MPPIHGGLGLPPHIIGIVLGAQGFVATTAVLVFSTRIQSYLGIKNAFTLSIGSFAVLMGAFPFMNALAVARGGELGWEVYAVLGIQISLVGLVTVGYGMSASYLV